MRIPLDVLAELEWGLERAQALGEGYHPATIVRAARWMEANDLTEPDLRLMATYFSTHDRDKFIEGWDEGTCFERINWALRGGDAGREFVMSMGYETEAVSPLLVRVATLDEFELQGPEGRSVVARMMYWDHPSRVSDDGFTFYNEVWRRGSFKKAIDNATQLKRGWPLMTNHKMGELPVGVATSIHERQDGPYFTGKISNTRAGDEIIELIKDGAVGQVSVHARAIRSRKTQDFTERLEVVPVEISFTPFGALHGSDIMALRHTIEPEVVPSTEARDELKEYLSTLAPPWAGNEA